MHIISATDTTQTHDMDKDEQGREHITAESTSQQSTSQLLGGIVRSSTNAPFSVVWQTEPSEWAERVGPYPHRLQRAPSHAPTLIAVESRAILSLCACQTPARDIFERVIARRTRRQ